jgi:putative SOS response-associated peptidase YedK
VASSHCGPGLGERMTVGVMLLLDIADRRVPRFPWVVGTTHTAVTGFRPRRMMSFRSRSSIRRLSFSSSLIAEAWDAAGTRLATCAIATCPSNELMAKIHNRMPVILPADLRDRWLDPAADESELRGLLVPFPSQELEAYEVSKLVNSPRNDSPDCVRPVMAAMD